MASRDEALETIRQLAPTLSLPDLSRKDIYCTPVPGPDGVVVGVLQLLNRTRPFTQQDYDFLKSVTEILGPVLKNAA